MDSFVLCEFPRWFFFFGGCVDKESVIILPRVGIIFSSFNI